MTDSIHGPSVSVVVPVRNGGSVIGPCIESVLESDYETTRLQIIVVDNASTDDTAAVLARFKDRVRIVQEDRTGPGAARNAGLRVAEGEIAAFTDADCVVDRAWVGELVRAGGHAGRVVGGRILAFPDANTIAHFGERIHDHRCAIEFCHPPYVITMNLAAPMAAIREIGGFDDRLLRGEDVDLGYRLAAIGCEIAYTPDAIIHHRNRDTLYTLAREAWLHGLYGVKVNRLHQTMLTELWDRVPGPVGDPPQGEYSSSLDPKREQLLWLWFRTFKRLGKTVGSFRSGALHHV